ncbi:MAG: hypothetical protein HY255_05130 [Betaproteobacteria bacterium]|nr:hypothetical protein [Betaproteobacteria bacterium]
MPAKPTIAAIANGDSTLVVWKSETRAGCLGYQVERELTRQGQTTTAPLNNRLGFGADSGTPGEQKPSSVWPFRRFSWSDHDVQWGDKVRYRVTPVYDNGGVNEVRNTEAGDWSDSAMEVTSEAGNYAVFFNRAVLLSQFMSRALNGDFSVANLKKFKNGLSQESKLRTFLGGNIREALLGLLTQVDQDAKCELYLALYELTDPDLIAWLCKLGPRVHIVLSNGSDKSKYDPADPKTGDENWKARAALNDAGCEVIDRMLASAGLGHNKFAVVRKNGNNLRVWTGSTNWTPTGLCTQMNNALVCYDPSVGDLYYKQWQLLKDAPGPGKAFFPPKMMKSNDVAHPIANSQDEVWFVRTSKRQDLDRLQALLGEAQQSIAFLMFSPGSDGVLQEVLSVRNAKPDLFVFGVVNDLKTPSAASGMSSLISGQEESQYPFSIVEPDGINMDLHDWAAEITHKQFVGNAKGPTIGHAIVHSKVLVIDAMGDDPIVITGSHNFSKSASTKNDENLIVIRGNKVLAQHYLVNIFAVYDHYRWNQVANTKKMQTVLQSAQKRDDTWQKSKLADSQVSLLWRMMGV